jgi:predicted transcriptional regulator
MLTVEIVAAYVANNRVTVSVLTDLIANTHATLAGLERETPAATQVAPLVPAVPIKKSVTPDYLISLEDGKPFKFLKRHLSRLGMTPNEYRQKWGLASDYPMVAATYAARRTEIAFSFGLGRKKVEPTLKATAVKPVRPGKRAAPA